ncbi:hypothetical protein LD119_00343 [Mesoplasma sp. JKS002660]|uniref:hypothetical protein n=1 Tax=Mesoplasma whartonense TaxID=2878854 RepID=UPI002022B5BC|nr:hypothetical protein [Mesoplasma sp. JKS002660]MCL8213415.1 hypothetical protein [Mesoplasma sp. JKS002660]
MEENKVFLIMNLSENDAKECIVIKSPMDENFDAKLYINLDKAQAEKNFEKVFTSIYEQLESLENKTINLVINTSVDSKDERNMTVNELLMKDFSSMLQDEIFNVLDEMKKNEEDFG